MVAAIKFSAGTRAVKLVMAGAVRAMRHFWREGAMAESGSAKGRRSKGNVCRLSDDAKALAVGLNGLENGHLGFGPFGRDDLGLDLRVEQNLDRKSVV